MTATSGAAEPRRREVDFADEGVIPATESRNGVCAMMRDDEHANAMRVYTVGQDRTGRWLVMEERGRGGGMFASREAAMRFAGVETAFRPGAVLEANRPIAFG